MTETTEQPARRGPGRPPMRPEVRPEQRDESRRDAKARALEILEGDSLDDDAVDQFNIDHIDRDPDWTYEWKNVSVLGKENRAYESRLARMGWEPVPADRHPEMMPKDYTGPIVRDGMMLMERPKIITDRIKERDRRAARAPLEQMREKLQGAAKEKTEWTGGNTKTSIKQSWQAPVPEE